MAVRNRRFPKRLHLRTAGLALLAAGALIGAPALDRDGRRSLLAAVEQAVSAAGLTAEGSATLSWFAVIGLALAAALVWRFARMTRREARAGQPAAPDRRDRALRALTAALEVQTRERRRAEQALQEAQERYSDVAELTSHFAYSFRIGENGGLVREWTIGAFASITGYTPEEADARGGWARLAHPADRAALWHHVRQVLEGQPHTVELRIRRRDGQIRWLRVASRPVWDAEQRQMRSFTGAGQDITDRKRLEQAVEHQSLHDPLTGLGNRRLFQHRLEHDLTVAVRQDTMLGVFMLDLDRFKEVNDTFGHRVGDQLLEQAAGRLNRAVRETDTVARLGGDEFAVVLPQVGGIEEAAATARRVAAALSEPFIVEGLRLSVGVSVGVAVCPDDGADAERLIRRADAAMYSAKRHGGGVALFSEAREAPRIVGC